MTTYQLRKIGGDAADPVTLGGEMTVGREASCDLQVTEGLASRRHALIGCDAEGAWVEDLGSKNGTFVNGAAVSGRTRLGVGDTVAFHQSRYLVEALPAGLSADPEATLVEAPDAGATVLAPPPEAAAAADPASPAPAADAADAAVPENVPRSWADPEFRASETTILNANVVGALQQETASRALPKDFDVPSLIVLTGQSSGTVLALGEDQDSWSIGTDDERDLQLRDSGISGFHAMISFDGRWRVIDQMSANGTFVNDVRTTVAFLQNGDRIGIGAAVCRVEGLDRRKASGAGAQAAGGRGWLLPVALIAGVLALGAGAALLLLQ